MSTSYYWSDPHFFHEAMVKTFTIACPTCGGTGMTPQPLYGYAISCAECGETGKIPARPFSSVGEMNDFITDTHNKVVGISDHSWCLGDVTMGRNAYHGKLMCAIVSRLHGKRRLILGNHDQLDMKYYGEVFQKIRGSARIDSLIFSHIPLAIQSIPVGCVNVHGHTHTQCLDGPYINVSLEAINYVPRSLEELRELARETRQLHPRWSEYRAG